MSKVTKTNKTYTLLKRLMGLALGLTLFSFSEFITAHPFCAEELNHTELRVSWSSHSKNLISLKGVIQQIKTARFCFDCKSNFIFSRLLFNQITEARIVANSTELTDLEKRDQVVEVQYAPRKSIDNSNS